MTQIICLNFPTRSLHIMFIYIARDHPALVNSLRSGLFWRSSTALSNRGLDSLYVEAHHYGDVTRKKKAHNADEYCCFSSCKILIMTCTVAQTVTVLWCLPAKLHTRQTGPRIPHLTIIHSKWSGHAKSCRPHVGWPTNGPWFNIGMSSYQYWKSHCGDINRS